MTKPDKNIEAAIKYRIDRALECIDEVGFLIGRTLWNWILDTGWVWVKCVRSLIR